VIILSASEQSETIYFSNVARVCDVDVVGAEINKGPDTLIFRARVRDRR
jgi:hypothetical protein